MKTSLHPEERIEKQGGANMQRGAETVGGFLYLTNLRLIFESHAFNVQTGNTVIPRDTIQSTRLVWTRFLRKIPIFPNSIEVITTDGSASSFVVLNREAWKRAIDR